MCMGDEKSYDRKVSSKSSTSMKNDHQKRNRRLLLCKMFQLNMKCNLLSFISILLTELTRTDAMLLYIYFLGWVRSRLDGTKNIFSRFKLISRCTRGRANSLSIIYHFFILYSLQSHTDELIIWLNLLFDWWWCYLLSRSMNILRTFRRHLNTKLTFQIQWSWIN
jgi:hypothetical protein